MGCAFFVDDPGAGITLQLRQRQLLPRGHALRLALQVQKQHQAAFQRRAFGAGAPSGTQAAALRRQAAPQRDLLHPLPASCQVPLAAQPALSDPRRTHLRSAFQRLLLHPPDGRPQRTNAFPRGTHARSQPIVTSAAPRHHFRQLPANLEAAEAAALFLTSRRHLELLTDQFPPAQVGHLRHGKELSTLNFFTTQHLFFTTFKLALSLC